MYAATSTSRDTVAIQGRACPCVTQGADNTHDKYLSKVRLEEAKELLAKTDGQHEYALLYRL